ncbi:MAG: hypothetical protein E7388_01735 [Ruminococcaceae bacterium]|nr:hypothetical protein [Oscillospiraceae bacterium]
MKNARQGSDPRFTIAALISAGLLQVSSIFSLARESGWIVVAIATAIIIPVCIMYGKLGEIAGRNVFTNVFGRIPGTVINILYVLYFIFFTSIDMRQASNLISGGMFPGLSPLIMPLLFAPILFYSAKNETNRVATLGFILFTMTALMTAADVVLQVSQLRFQNYLPIINASVGDFSQAVFFCVTVAMGRLSVLLFILPESGSRPNYKGYGWGALFGGVFLLVVALRDVGILGVLVSYLSNTVFETVQLLDAFGFLSRVEILFIFMHIVTITYVMCLWTGVSTDLTGEILPVKNKKNTFVVIGIVLIIMVTSVFVFTTSAILREFIKNIFPYISVWFVLIFPVMALIVGLIRRPHGGKM